MSTFPSDQIFQLSDLNRSGKTVMDAARANRARIRDADGSSFVILREAQLVHLEHLAQAAVNLAIVERSRSRRGSERLDLLELADWPWLAEFDSEDLAEFITEVRDALIRSIHEADSSGVLRVLDAWRVTARALADDERRDVLLGSTSDAEFVAVDRPRGSA